MSGRRLVPVWSVRVTEVLRFGVGSLVVPWTTGPAVVYGGPREWVRSPDGVNSFEGGSSGSTRPVRHRSVCYGLLSSVVTVGLSGEKLTPRVPPKSSEVVLVRDV